MRNDLASEVYVLTTTPIQHYVDFGANDFNAKANQTTRLVLTGWANVVGREPFPQTVGPFVSFSLF